MAEKRVIELEIQDNSKTLKAQYKEAVVEVQRLAQVYGETSKEVAEAAKRAAELKDKIEDTNDAIAAFKGEGKFVAAGKALSAIASGLAAVEGGLVLIGVESESLQKTMLKVQAAMALAQGLEGLEDAGRAFKQLGTVAVNAFKGIRGALIATGIGALVVALGTIVAYWDDIKASVSGVSKEQQKLNEISHEKYETSKAELSNLDAQDNILKLQGKSEREILNIKIKKVNTAIELGKIELQNTLKTSQAEEKAALENYNLTKKVIDFIVDTALFLPKLMLMPIDMAIKGANKVSEALGFGKVIAFDMTKTLDYMTDQFSGFLAEKLFDPEQIKAEGKKNSEEIKKQIADLENQKAGFQLAIREIDKTANEKAKADADDKNKIINDANAEAARLAIEQQNELNKRLEDLAEENYQNNLTDKERELLAVQDKYFELETLAEGNADALSQIELAKMNEINDINLKYQDIAYENDKVAKEKKAELDKEASEKEIANAKAVAEAKAQIQQQGLDVAMQGVQLIATLFEKQKAVQKAAVIAESVIGIAKIVTSTQAANAGAIAKYSLIPGGQALAATEIALNRISAGIGIASNIAATAKALQALGGGASPNAPNVEGSAGGGVTAPSFNVIGSSGVNQLAQIQQQPTRAYVVSGDIANGLSLERNRLQNASF